MGAHVVYYVYTGDPLVCSLDHWGASVAKRNKNYFSRDVWGSGFVLGYLEGAQKL